MKAGRPLRARRKRRLRRRREKPLPLPAKPEKPQGASRQPRLKGSGKRHPKARWRRTRPRAPVRRRRRRPTWLQKPAFRPAKRKKRRCRCPNPSARPCPCPPRRAVWPPICRKSGNSPSCRQKRNTCWPSAGASMPTRRRRTSWSPRICGWWPRSPWAIAAMACPFPKSSPRATSA